MKNTAIILIALIPILCFAASDHLAKTYQPLRDQSKGICVVPVYFTTLYSSPDTEISMICSANALGDGDANLASLFGLSLKVGKLKHRGSVSVTIDLTNFEKPDGLDFTPSPFQVLEATVQCLIKLLQEHDHSNLHIIIKCPEDKMLPEWKEFEKTYQLTKE